MESRPQVLALCLFLLLGDACLGRRTREAEQTGQKQPVPYKLVLPLGLSAESAAIPSDNPMTLEKLKLGKRLYFEKGLSFDRTISCASCHIPEKGFADPERFSKGIGGQRGTRQAPSVVNRLFSGRQFWDGRAASLEEQAAGPVQNPVEMGMPNMKIVVDRLKGDPAYEAMFKAAFPEDGITERSIARAIAAFERTILSGNSPYDRFMAGDKSAMSEAAQRGLKLFRDESKGNCETCHVSFNFTDENYNNLGVGMASDKPDMGRYVVTCLEGHQGAFKTPTLREVANTAPYMHDGSERTLEQVMDLYEKGGHPNKWLSPKMKPLRLTREEKQDIVEFLKALSGQVTWYGKGE
jgi:cytochrome c peroxidase